VALIRTVTRRSGPPSKPRPPHRAHRPQRPTWPLQGRPLMSRTIFWPCAGSFSSAVQAAPPGSSTEVGVTPPGRPEPGLTTALLDRSSSCPWSALGPDFAIAQPGPSWDRQPFAQPVFTETASFWTNGPLATALGPCARSAGKEPSDRPTSMNVSAPSPSTAL